MLASDAGTSLLGKHLDRLTGRNLVMVNKIFATAAVFSEDGLSLWHFGEQYRTWLVGQTSFLRRHLHLLVHGVHCRRLCDSHRQTSSKSRRSGPSCWLPKTLRGQGPANSAAAGSRIDVPPLAAASPVDGEKKLPKTLRGQDPTKRAAIDVPTLAAAGSGDGKNSRRRKRRFSTTPRSYVQTTEATYQPNSKNPRSLLFTRWTILFTTSMRYSGGRLCDSTSVWLPHLHTRHALLRWSASSRPVVVWPRSVRDNDNERLFWLLVRSGVCIVTDLLYYTVHKSRCEAVILHWRSTRVTTRISSLLFKA